MLLLFRPAIQETDNVNEREGDSQNDGEYQQRPTEVQENGSGGRRDFIEGNFGSGVGDRDYECDGQGQTYNGRGNRKEKTIKTFFVLLFHFTSPMEKISLYIAFYAK